MKIRLEKQNVGDYTSQNKKSLPPKNISKREKPLVGIAFFLHLFLLTAKEEEEEEEAASVVD